MKRLFLLLALCGMVAVGCTEGGVDDNIDNGGNNTEQPGEDDDDENKEDDAIFITDSKGNVVVEAEGGEVVVTVTTDIKYSVEIPEEAQSWLSVADTRAIRMEKLTFTIADNDTFEERSANVELVDSDGKSLQTIKFLQRASDKVFEIDDEGKYIIEAQGGVIEVDVTTNIEYDVVIPDDAQQWISVADTRAIRMEKLTFTIADNDTFEERSANVELVDSDGKSLQTIKFLQRASDKVFEIDDEGKYIIEAQGGVIEVDVTTNIEYDVVIPDDAQQWISVADTRAEVRNEKLTFTVAANETFEERSADVELVDSKGKSLQTINFTQLAKSNVMANNEIWYTTTDNKRIIPPSTEPTVFGAYFISNTYSDGKGVLTFDGEITKIGNGAFKNIGNLASITIPDSVTSIGSSAFYGCSNLTSITIPDSVKSIGSEAFRNCTSLTSVTIPDSVTSIGSYAFRNCDLLTSVTIPDSVTSIGNYAFYDCDSLTSVTIPDSVTSIGDFAFYDCTSLTSVTIGKGVTSIGKNAFYGCSNLTSITIPDSVKSIGSEAFYYCTSLTSVTIGNGVTSIGSEAFYGCTSLKSVYITDIAAWCNISFGDYCSNPLYYAKNLYLNNELITDLIIPDGATKIGSYAFYNCTSLTSVTIPDSVTSIGIGAFYECNSLTSVTIPDSVTSIGRSAFSRCTSLTSITIPDSVTSIGDYAFYYCTLLTSVTIGKGVTSIGYEAFYGCTGELIVNCNIPNAKTYESLYRGVFYGSKFTQVTIGNGVTSIGSYAFEDFDSLTSITIPDSVTWIGERAFRSCSSLTSVTIGNGVTEIGNSAFEYCTSLKSVYITDIAAWCNISFGDYESNPLYYAKNLYLNNELVTDLIIPGSVTSIRDFAFRNCDPLTSVTIGKGVTSIGNKAFCGCTSLKEVYCKPTTPPTGGSSMFNGNASGRKIYVPRNSVSAYKSASGWSDYASAIVGYDF